MKILFVSCNPLPFTGGIWTFVSRLTERLKQMGHEVKILSLDHETSNYRIISQQPEISREVLLPYISEKLDKIIPTLHSNSFIYHSEVRRYALELSALYYGLQQWDIIYAQDVIAACAISRVKPSHIPLVTSAHGYLSGEIFYYLKNTDNDKTDAEIKDSFEYNYFKHLENVGYHASNFIHAQSSWMGNIIVNEFSISPTKLCSFPYGMDTEKFVKFIGEKSSLPQSGGKKVILYTGRLVYLKGLTHLIDALAMLKQDRKDWMCWILGEGELKSTLEQQCKDLGIANDVKFFGVSNEVPHFLRQADIFVLPGLQDTQPHSVMEAQLSGLPVIVSDATGLPEMVVNGETGLIFSSGNAHQLYERLKSLLENDFFRKQLGNHAKEWAKDYWSIDKMVNNILTMCQRAINE